MTNKPMLSVDRELLERIAKPLKVWADKPYRTKAILELRALLDKDFDGDSRVPAKQGEPVADNTQCEECKGWGYHENYHEGGGTECGECGGSGKASVAVAMPQRKPQDLSRDDQPMADWFEGVGYNKALDDVALLNSLSRSKADLEAGRTVSSDQMKKNLEAKFLGRKS